MWEPSSFLSWGHHLVSCKYLVENYSKHTCCRTFRRIYVEGSLSSLNPRKQNKATPASADSSAEVDGQQPWPCMQHLQSLCWQCFWPILYPFTLLQGTCHKGLHFPGTLADEKDRSLSAISMCLGVESVTPVVSGLLQGRIFPFYSLSIAG